MFQPFHFGGGTHLRHDSPPSGLPIGSFRGLPHKANSLQRHGWRWIAFDLTNLSRAGHWGGANDGIPRGNLPLDCPLLVDGGKHETKGSIHFTGICWIQSSISK
jgi:hypothetical protein